MHDYAPKAALARIAIPAQRSGQWFPRLWIKGSESRRVAKVGERSIALNPPYFTATHELTVGFKGSITVEFPAIEPSDATTKIRLVVPDFERLFAANRPQTIAIYGCFQPFGTGVDPETIDHDIGRTISLLETGNKRVDDAQQNGAPAVPYHELSAGEKLGYPNMVVRDLFQKLVCHPNLEFSVKDRKGNKSSSDLWGAPTTLVLGTGDQIYTDSGYHDYGDFGVGHPLSAWTIERYPLPRWTVPLRDQPSSAANLAGFERLLHQAYLHHGSFEFEEIFRMCPRVSTWDDHEIRDGWGSTGDEEKYEDHFAAARNAFAAHQVAMGPLPVEDPAWRQKRHFDQELDVGGLPIYLLDLRSQRGRSTEFPVLSQLQETAFADWLQRLEPGSTYVVVSSMPMTPTNSVIDGALAGIVEPELRDDLKDGWHSGANKQQLDRILSSMIRARIDRDIKPIIVSGDVHQSALVRIWYNESESYSTHGFSSSLRAAGRNRVRAPKKVRDWYAGARLLGVEMVVSGLSNGTFDGSSFAESMALRRERLLENPDVIELHDEEDRRLVGLKLTLDHQVIGPNFGAIERLESGDFVLHFVAYSYEHETAMFSSSRVNWDQRWSGSPLIGSQQPKAKRDYFLIEAPQQPSSPH